jgi:hypothetical protein
MWAETGSTALHANSKVAKKWRLPAIFFCGPNTPESVKHRAN